MDVSNALSAFGSYATAWQVCTFWARIHWRVVTILAILSKELDSISLSINLLKSSLFF